MKRVVVKIGSSSLSATSGGLCEQKLQEHSSALAKLHSSDYDVILVSSGAVAAGYKLLGLDKRPREMTHKQAAAAIGQGLLMQAYGRAFSDKGIALAQVLLTHADFMAQNQYNNAHNALSFLLERRVLPIINENDTVATEELSFGDNDMLSALVAKALNADMLIILTDTDGVYDSDPRINSQAKRISRITSITSEIESLAGDTQSSVGTGGMKSKIAAAKTALARGVSVFVGTGHGEDKLLNICAGRGNGTYFGEESKCRISMV